jgi:hypothetical protein
MPERASLLDCVALVDAAEALERVGLVREDRRGHRRDVVARDIPAVAARRARIDRHPGDQRILGQLTVVLEVAAQGAGADASTTSLIVTPGAACGWSSGPRGELPCIEHLVRRQSTLKRVAGTGCFGSSRRPTAVLRRLIQARRERMTSRRYAAASAGCCAGRGAAAVEWRQVRGLLVRRLQRYERRAAVVRIGQLAKKRISEAPSTAAW